MHGEGCFFLSSIGLWERPLASVDVVSPICPIYPHRIAADGQTIPSSPRDVVRDGGGQSSDTLRQPFTQLFQSAAKWKHILLLLITKLEAQLMKNLGSPPQSLQHGLFHCKHTHTFIYTMPAPGTNPCGAYKANLNKFSAEWGERWWRSICLNINLPHWWNTGNLKEIAGLAFICHVCGLKTQREDTFKCLNEHFTAVNLSSCTNSKWLLYLYKPDD